MDSCINEDYLTNKSMWLINLPIPIGNVVFKLLLFYKRVVGLCKYIGFLWKYQCTLDHDYREILDLMCFKLQNVRQQFNQSGKTTEERNMIQSELFLHQYLRPDLYVTVPEFLQGKDILDFIEVKVDSSGEVSIETKLEGKELEAFNKYKRELSRFKESSWEFFWSSLATNARSWK